MHLAKCISNVEELRLERCDIGAIGVESLSQGIMQRDHPVITMLIYCSVNIFIWLFYKQGLEPNTNLNREPVKTAFFW